MRRAPSLLALAGCAALALAAGDAAAQQRFRRGQLGGPPREGGAPQLVRRPAPTAPRPGSPPQPPPAQPAPAQPGLAQPGQAAPAQPCSQGHCSGSAQVLSARPAANLTVANPAGALPSSAAAQPGALPAQGTGALPASSSALMVQPAPLPAPRQPLGDALAAETVRITIRAISAQRQGAGLEIDGRLAPIDQDLRSFADEFSYRNYRLLDAQTFDLDFRSIAQMELPGSHAIEVEPRQVGQDGRVKLHLELLGHPEHVPRMRADYSIPRGRTILVGGYRLDPNAPDSGTLLLAITQDE